MHRASRQVTRPPGEHETLARLSLKRRLAAHWQEPGHTRQRLGTGDGRRERDRIAHARERVGGLGGDGRRFGAGETGEQECE